MVFICGYFALGLTTDNSIESFFIKSSDEAKTYEKFVNEFGADEALAVGVCGKPEDKEAMRNLEKMSIDLLKLPNAIEVISPARFIAGGASLAHAESVAKAARFVSADGAAMLALVFFDNNVKDNRRKIYEEAGRIKDKWAQKFSCFHIAGHTVLNAALDFSGEEVAKKYLPILLAFTVIMLFAMYRNMILIVAPLVITVFAQALTLGIIAISNVSFGLVLTLIPTMIFIFTVASTIHICFHFLTLLHEEPQATVDEVIQKTYDEKMGAVFYSLVTTSAGFFSLLLSSVEPIRNLGLFAGIGCLMIMASVWTALPSFLKRVKRESSHSANVIIRWKGDFLEKVVKEAIRFRYAIIIICVVIGASSVAALKSLPVNTNALEYFQDSSAVRQDVRWMEKNLAGISQVNLLIGAGIPENKKKIFIGALRGSGDALSIITKKSLAGFDNPIMEANGKERIILQCVTGGKRSLDILLNDIEKAKKLAGIKKVTVTGLYPLLLESQEEMIRTLTGSLIMAMVAIGVLLMFIVRSVPLVLAAAIPNLTTVFTVFLYMYLFSIPIDLITVTIAAVVLGIAVDDTVHLLMSYQKHLASEKSSVSAIQKSIRAVGAPVILTSVILGTGFLTFSTSSFLPISEFGVLMCAAIFTALVLDLVATPAMLYVANTIFPMTGSGRPPEGDKNVKL